LFVGEKMNTTDPIQIIIYNGLFTLLGVALGSIFPIIKDLILSNYQKKIEYIKIHDKDRIEAYKALFTFIRNLQIITWPDNDTVYKDFIDDCRKNLEYVIPNYPYFSVKIIKQLERIESLYNMTMIDAEWVRPPKEAVEKELPNIATELYRLTIEDFKRWNK
jgi:hypothetical protein